MKVLYAASEALPFIASGGLADVAGSLPVAMRKRLVGCRVVLAGRKSKTKPPGTFIPPSPEVGAITRITAENSWRPTA